MEIDKSTKIKIILFSVIGILVLGGAYLVVDMFIDDTDSTPNTSLRNSTGGEFSYNDLLNRNIKEDKEKESTVLSARNQRNYSLGEQSTEADNIYQEPDEDIKTIQDLIREQKASNNTVQPVINAQSITSSVPVTIPKQVIVSQEPVIEKEKEIIETKEEEKIEESKDFFFNPQKKKMKGNSIPAVIIGDQYATEGGSIRFQLEQDLLSDGGIIIPKGTYIYATTRFDNNRLQLILSTVKLNNDIIRVSQDVYSSDGLKGLEIDDSTKAKLTKLTKAGAIQGAEAPQGGTETGIINKATNIVTTATKSVLSRENEELKVFVRANTKIFILVK